MNFKKTPTVLTIAGSDPYGGAGIQVDAKIIHALGGYAFSVTTALTAQNSTGVKGVFPTAIECFRVQLNAILDDIKVDAVKIGMLVNAEIIEVVAEAIVTYKLKNIVLDTVLVSTSGEPLLEEDAIEVMVKKLFPLVDVITPNIPETACLLHYPYKGEEEEIEAMAEGLFALKVKALLIKGGHRPSSTNAIDYLYTKGELQEVISTARVDTAHTHGTGCVLSSAIATELAKGETLSQAVKKAKVLLYEYLQIANRINFSYRDETIQRKKSIL